MSTSVLRQCALDLPRRVQSVEFGHADIQDDHIRLELLREGYCFPSICSLPADFPAFLLLDQHPHAVPHDFVIVGEKNAKLLHGRIRDILYLLSRRDFALHDTRSSRPPRELFCCHRITLGVYPLREMQTPPRRSSHSARYSPL